MKIKANKPQRKIKQYTRAEIRETTLERFEQRHSELIKKGEKNDFM